MACDISSPCRALTGNCAPNASMPCCEKLAFGVVDTWRDLISDMSHIGTTGSPDRFCVERTLGMASINGWNPLLHDPFRTRKLQELRS